MMDPVWYAVATLVHLQLACGGCGSTELSVSNGSDVVYVVEGNGYSLHCQFNKMIPACSWSRNGSGVKIQDRYRYANGNGSNTENCTLSVVAANRSLDEGHWYCTACSTSEYDGISSERITVHVVSKPEIRWNGTKVAHLYAPWNKTLDVHLKCIFQNGSIFPATLIWTVDQTPISAKVPDGTELEWNRTISLQMNKEIACSARNSSTFKDAASQPLLILQHADRKLNLTINGRPIDDTHVVVKDEQFEMKCVADGEPQPIYCWMHQSDEDDSNWTFYQEGQRVIVTKQVGSFRCVAFDGLNMTNVTRSVRIIRNPSNSKQNSETDDFMTLLVIVAGGGGSIAVTMATSCFIVTRTVSRNRNRRSGESIAGSRPPTERTEVEGIEIPPPPVIPLPPIPQRSTLLQTAVTNGLTSPPAFRRWPPPPPLNGSKLRSVCSTDTSKAPDSVTHKAPQPLPRQIPNNGTTSRSETSSGYIMADRPDLLPSNSSSNVNRQERIEARDASYYSTIVPIGNRES